MTCSVFVPDGHHQALLFDQAQIHLENIAVGRDDDTVGAEYSYFKVESFVKIRFCCFVEDISLLVVFLEVATTRVGIKQIDQGVRVLTSLPMELSLAKVNIETAGSVVDLAWQYYNDKERTITALPALIFTLSFKVPGETSLYSSLPTILFVEALYNNTTDQHSLIGSAHYLVCIGLRPQLLYFKRHDCPPPVPCPDQSRVGVCLENTISDPTKTDKIGQSTEHTVK